MRPATARDLPRGRAWAWLAAVTLAGALLRFWALDRPPVWGDEARVFARTFGSWAQMVDWLKGDSFTPLHYYLVWWLGHGLPIGTRGGEPLLLLGGPVRLTPAVLRLPSAVAGTLFVPIVYWLAAELLGRRRAALTAALLAATSAYLLVYARDAKMYMGAWTLLTAHAAAGLAWLRLRRAGRAGLPAATAYAAWVVLGVLMVGYQGATAVVLAVEVVGVVMFALLRRRPPRAAMLEVGAAVAGAAVVVGCLGAYLGVGSGDGVFHVTGLRRIVAGHTAPAEHREAAGGTVWVGDYNLGRDVHDHLGYTASAWLTGWEWPRRQDDWLIDEDERRARRLATLACGALVAVGLALPRRRGAADLGGWRGTYLLTWLLVPTAFWWAISRGDGRIDRDLVPPVWAIVAAGLLLAVFVVARARRPRSTARAIHAAVPAMVAVGLAALVLATVDRPGGTSVWMPRYLGFVLPAAIVLAAAGLGRLPTRPLRWGAIALVVGINLAGFGRRVVADTEPPADRAMADLALAAEDDSTAIVIHYRTRLSDAISTAAPGGGYFFSRPAGYYAILAFGLDPRPVGGPASPGEAATQAEASNPWRLLERLAGDASVTGRYAPREDVPAAEYAEVAAERASPAGVRRLVAWSGSPTTDPRGPWSDAGLLARLRRDDPSWRLAEERVYAVRDHWTWRTFNPVRRRVFERP